MRPILRHAAPGIVLALVTIFAWWAPILFVLLLCVTMPPLLRRAWRARAAAELAAAKALYFGRWADRIDAVWLPSDVKAWLARPRLLTWRRAATQTLLGGQKTGPAGDPGR